MHLAFFVGTSACAQLAVWDEDELKLKGVPVVVGPPDDERIVYVNIQSSPFGNSTIAMEIDEDGRLLKLETNEDTSEMSAIDFAKMLPLVATVVAAVEAID